MKYPDDYGAWPRDKQDAHYAERQAAEQIARVPGVVSIAASDIIPEPISWLWDGWLARSKLHLIAGVPSAGKTTIALACAAIISAGERWPDKTRAKARKVLIWSSEDDAADTLNPRLMRMGADRANIRFVTQTTIDNKPRPFNPATDMAALVAHTKAIGNADLLIIDPVVAAIGVKVDSHNNSQTRIGLQPVVDFAVETQCAVLGVTHFTKGTAGQDPVERVTGSLAFGALPRIVWAVAKGKEGDENPRILVRAKSNLGLSGGGFGFDIDAASLMERPDIIATRIVWLGAIEGTAKELLDGAEPNDEKSNKQDMAESFLKLRLKPGDKMPAKDIEEEAAACGISLRTLKRAKPAAKIRSVQTKGMWWFERD